MQKKTILILVFAEITQIYNLYKLKHFKIKRQLRFTSDKLLGQFGSVHYFGKNEKCSNRVSQFIEP